MWPTVQLRRAARTRLANHGSECRVLVCCHAACAACIANAATRLCTARAARHIQRERAVHPSCVGGVRVRQHHLNVPHEQTQRC